MSAEKLKEQFVYMRSQGLSSGSVFFDQLHTNPNDYAVTQFCLWLLDSMTEANTVLEAMRAALEIAYRQQTYTLSRLRRIRQSLPARKGGFRDYRQDVDRAIIALEKSKLGRLCRCEIVSLFDHAPEAHDFIKVTNVNSSQPDEKLIECCCDICQRQWRVTYTDSYHYPIYRWAKSSE